jgi:hypothetical protein
METITQNDNTIFRITNLIKCLAVEQQELLEKNLQRLVMSMEGERLAKSVKPNNITMDEIVAELKFVTDKDKEKDKDKENNMKSFLKFAASNRKIVEGYKFSREECYEE